VDKIKWPATLFLASTALGSVCVGPADAQLLTQLPQASLPLTGLEICYMVQAGVSKQYYCNAVALPPIPGPRLLGNPTSTSEPATTIALGSNLSLSELANVWTLNAAGSVSSIVCGSGISCTPAPIITTGTVSLAPCPAGQVLANTGTANATPACTLITASPCYVWSSNDSIQAGTFDVGTPPWISVATTLTGLNAYMTTGTFDAALTINGTTVGGLGSVLVNATKTLTAASSPNTITNTGTLQFVVSNLGSTVTGPGNVCPVWTHGIT